jgi:hypothetical protein
MKPALLVTLALLMAGTAACSGPSTRWEKGGATAEDLRLDQDQCSSRSQGYDFVFDDRDSGRPGVVESGVDTRARRAGSAAGQVYRDCMETRGWRRERGGQTPR